MALRSPKSKLSGKGFGRLVGDGFWIVQLCHLIGINSRKIIGCPLRGYSRSHMAVETATFVFRGSICKYYMQQLIIGLIANNPCTAWSVVMWRSLRSCTAKWLIRTFLERIILSPRRQRTPGPAHRWPSDAERNCWPYSTMSILGK